MYIYFTFITLPKYRGPNLLRWPVAFKKCRGAMKNVNHDGTLFNRRYMRDKSVMWKGLSSFCFEGYGIIMTWKGPLSAQYGIYHNWPWVFPFSGLYRCNLMIRKRLILGLQGLIFIIVVVKKINCRPALWLTALWLI